MCLIVIFMVHEIENMSEKFWSHLTTFRLDRGNLIFKFISALYNSSMHVCRYAGMQICKYVTVQVYNYASKQVFRYGSIQLCKNATI